MKLKKAAMFTDIHWGAKQNSERHNTDCLNYIKWFCDQVQADKTIDHIMFLGDWHENRSTINVSTLNFSHKGIKMIDDLGLPVYLIIGNHDLYHRTNRELHSIPHFCDLKNIILIDKLTILENTIKPCLVAPFLFEEEYSLLNEYLHIPIWMGHFEIRDFVIAGYNITSNEGLIATNYKNNTIFSGHYHKRQANENVVYIGNTFPTSFADAGDNNRGMATYNYIDDDIQFLDWIDCPKYIKTTLSDLLDEKVTLYPNSRVKCIVDIPISFEESSIIRQKFLDKYNLREFILEESLELANALANTETKVDVNDDDLATVNELVIQMLTDITADTIDNELLISIFCSIGEADE